MTAKRRYKYFCIAISVLRYFFVGLLFATLIIWYLSEIKVLDWHGFEPINVFISLILERLSWFLQRSCSSEEETGLRTNEHDRHLMLGLFEQSWVDGVLRQLSNGSQLIEIDFEPRPNLVDILPAQKAVSSITATTSVPPKHGKIISFFDSVHESVLILGEAGSGKTTMLLDLAHELLVRAKKETSCPIPVYLDLISWPVMKQSLAEWIVTELHEKYRVPERISRDWVKDDKLVLLLDNLDRVISEAHELSILKLNEFFQVHLVSSAICSRTTEYESLTLKLQMRGAIILKPLTTAQISKYLSTRNVELSAVKQTLRSDETLSELAKTPLMLSAMTLAYHGMSAEQVRLSRTGKNYRQQEVQFGDALGSLEARRNHILESYINRRISPESSYSRYTPQEIIRWLSWLAQQLTKNHQRIFLIEQLQPIWLEGRASRWIYALISRVILCMSVGLVVGIGVGGANAFGGVSRDLSRLANMLIIGSEFSFFAGLAIGTVDALRFEIPRTQRKVDIWVMFWRVFLNTLVIWFVLRLIFGLLLHSQGTEELELAYSFIFAIRGSRQSLARDIQTVEKLSWSGSKAAIGAGRGIIAGIILTLLYGLVVHPQIAIVSTRSPALMIAFSVIINLFYPDFGIKKIIPKFCKSRIKWKLPLKEEKQGLNCGFLGKVNKIFGIIIFEMGLFSFQAAEL